MKQRTLLFSVALLLSLGSSVTLHAQQNELDANLSSCIPHDATWQSTSNGFKLTWNNLGKKLALTHRNNTLTLKDNCNFGSYDGVTMHITYELDTELPDGTSIYYTKAELKNAVGGGTTVDLRSVRTKSHERTMDVTINPETVGGFGNIKKIYLQSAHEADNGGALYVKDVTFDVPTIVAEETTAQKFSSRRYTGNVYLFQNIAAGTFAGATKITFTIANVFDSRPEGQANCEVWATVNGGADINITPTNGETKYAAANGTQDCYLNSVDVSKITGIYVVPKATAGFLTFDASCDVYNGSGLMKSSGSKTFNARSSESNVVMNLFTSNQPAGTFTNAKQIRLNFSNFSERNTSGGRYRIRAVLNDGSTPEVSVPYSSSDNNEGLKKVLNIPNGIDKSKIVNFTIEQLLTQGDVNFEVTTRLLNDDVHEKGDGFGDTGINPNKSPYLTLYKGGVVASSINDIDLTNVQSSGPEQQINGNIFSWTSANSNYRTYDIPGITSGQNTDFSGYKVAINTSEATMANYESRSNIRFRLQVNGADGAWVALNGYGTHVVDIDSLFKSGNSYNSLDITKITGITIAGEQDYDHQKGVISVNALKLFKDIAIAKQYDTRFPLDNSQGYAENVNIASWENNNTLEWNNAYSNQIYIKWNEGTEIADLSQYSSITLNHGEITTSPYRVLIYYGNGVDDNGNIADKKIITVPSGVTEYTINFANAFGSDVNRLKDVRCIAIAGNGDNGSVKFTDIHLNRTLKGMGLIPYGPINGTDIVDYQQLLGMVVETTNKVTFTPEFLMNDNSVVNTTNTYTTTNAGTAHFYIHEMLSGEQIPEVKNVRLKIVSQEDGDIEFSRIYLSNYINLEWDKYKKANIDNNQLKFEPTLDYKNAISWDAYYIPIYPEDLSDLKRISFTAESNKETFDAGIAFYNEDGDEIGFETISNGISPFNFYNVNAASLTNVAKIKVFFKQNDAVKFKNLTLYKSLPIYAEERESYEVTDMEYFRADDATYYNDGYHKQIADVMIGTSTLVVFGEVGATYVGRDGDIQSYYIMNENDEFLTNDKPAENKRADLINTYGTKTFTFDNGNYILETNTRPGGYADLSEYSELRIWKDYSHSASQNNNDAPVRAFFVANTRDLTGYLTVDSVGTNFPLLVTDEYCSIDLDQIKKVCNGKAYLISIKGMNSAAAPTVNAISVYKTKANYTIGGDNLIGANAENCITNALLDGNATYIDATDVSTTEYYTLPVDLKNPNCLIYTNNSNLIGQNVICNGKATQDIALSNSHDFYAPFDVDMNGHTVSYAANIYDNFSTLVLPFATTLPDADVMRVYTVKGNLDEGTSYVEAHQLEPGSTLPANTPVLLRVPNDNTTTASFTFTGSKIEATPFEIKNEGFVGSYTTQRIPGSGSSYRNYNPYASKSDLDSYTWDDPVLVPNRYVLQKQDGQFAFYSVNRDEVGNMYKPLSTPFKCWLASTNNMIVTNDETNNVKAMIKFFEFKATDIKCIKNVTNEQIGVKTYYNLQGQQLKAPQAGFNIINGKKVFVK